MVNIVAVISINSEVVITFKNIDDWWQHILDKATPADRPNRISLRRGYDRLSDELATAYGINPLWTKNVCFLFGSHSETRRQMSDFETRELLVNPKSKIVYHIRSGLPSEPGKVFYIASIHVGKIYKKLVTEVSKELSNTGNKNINKES